MPRAIQAANKLINRDNVFLMLLGMGTPMNNAVLVQQLEAGPTEAAMARRRISPPWKATVPPIWWCRRSSVPAELTLEGFLAALESIDDYTDLFGYRVAFGPDRHNGAQESADVWTEPSPWCREALLDGRDFNYSREAFLHRESYRHRSDEPTTDADGVRGTAGSVSGDELYTDIHLQKTFWADNERLGFFVRMQRFEDFDGRFDRQIVGVQAQLGSAWQVALAGDVKGSKAETDVQLEARWQPDDHRLLRLVYVAPELFFNDKDGVGEYDKQPHTVFLHYRHRFGGGSIAELVCRVRARPAALRVGRPSCSGCGGVSPRPPGRDAVHRARRSAFHAGRQSWEPTVYVDRHDVSRHFAAAPQQRARWLGGQARRPLAVRGQRVERRGVDGQPDLPFAHRELWRWQRAAALAAVRAAAPTAARQSGQSGKPGVCSKRSSWVSNSVDADRRSRSRATRRGVA
ncbi:MAG: hypothetical protein ACNA7W_03515 [Pseudomonadales bacterium]